MTWSLPQGEGELNCKHDSFSVNISHLFDQIYLTILLSPTSVPFTHFSLGTLSSDCSSSTSRKASHTQIFALGVSSAYRVLPSTAVKSLLKRHLLTLTTLVNTQAPTSTPDLSFPWSTFSFFP